MIAYFIAAVAVLLAYPVGRAAFAVGRWVIASRAHKRNSLTTVRVRISWRWTMRNLELARVDRHKTDQRKAQGLRGNVYLYPRRRRLRADQYGFSMRVRTAPGVSEKRWQDAATDLAHAWRVRRIQVSVLKPGRLLIRAVRSDPLAVPLPIESAPEGAHSSVSRLYVGRDALSQHRYLDISGVPGVVVAGLPGYGKSSLLNSWLYGLVRSPEVALSIIDGKGGSDFQHLRDRCSIYVRDEVDHVLAALELEYAVLRMRQATIRSALGVSNYWHRGPSAEWPLHFIVIDEAHGFFDVRSAVGKEEQAKIARIIYLVTQLIKKGRSAGFCVVLASQKVTADSIPTAIRDVCSAMLSFAVRTQESAVAALGPDIGEYPDVSPVRLLDRSQYIGVCTAALGDSDLEPFCQVRTPYVPDEVLQSRAREAAGAKPADREYLDTYSWSGADEGALMPTATIAAVATAA